MRHANDLVSDYITAAEPHARYMADTLVAGEPHVEAWLEHDVPLNSPSARTTEDLDAIKDWTFIPRAFTGLSALVDVTSIVTLEQLLDGQHLSPLTLWDLSRMVSAIVSFDNLFYFENPNVDTAKLNALLGRPVFHTIPLPGTGPLYDPHGVRDLFNTAWTDTHDEMSMLQSHAGADNVYGRKLDDLAQRWAAALGRDMSVEDVADRQESDHSWRSPGAALLSQLWAQTRTSSVNLNTSTTILRKFEAGTSLGEKAVESRRRQLRKTIRECNYRGMVNQRLAIHLDLPYVANTARLPFRDVFLDIPKALSDRLPSVLAADDSYSQAASVANRVSGQPLVVPVFLAVALRRASRPEDLWGVIGELRDDARGYRKRRLELETALSDGNLDTIANLHQALRLHTAQLSERVTAAVSTTAESLTTSVQTAPVSHLAGLPSSWIGTGLSALIAGSRKLLPQEMTRRLMWRFCKPELRFLNQVAQESRAISTAMPRVQKMWAVADSDADQFLNRFAAFGHFTDHSDSG